MFIKARKAIKHEQTLKERSILHIYWIASPTSVFRGDVWLCFNYGSVCFIYVFFFVSRRSKKGNGNGTNRANDWPFLLGRCGGIHVYIGLMCIFVCCVFPATNVMTRGGWNYIYIKPSIYVTFTLVITLIGVWKVLHSPTSDIWGPRHLSCPRPMTDQQLLYQTTRIKTSQNQYGYIRIHTCS